MKRSMFFMLSPFLFKTTHRLASAAAGHNRRITLVMDISSTAKSLRLLKR